MDLFEDCRLVNDLLLAGDAPAARDRLIRLLDAIKTDKEVEYTPLVNRLIRDVGLYPYMDMRSASWEERYVHAAFEVDVGESEPLTLHREQQRLLGALLAGKNIAVSAPTSFGKSFVIDAFIAIQRPPIVVIIVPTIALADETRRRLQRKFGRLYKIITASDQTVADNMILICPQERAIGYAKLLKTIDILIVDEFYKASKVFDKERAPSLIRSIVELGRIAKQRYYLAPNIHDLGVNVFTAGMEFMPLDFNTVFLEKKELYKEIGKDAEKKKAALSQILRDNLGKSLIYAGTYKGVEQVASVLIDGLQPSKSKLLNEFQAWLAEHYELNWGLTRLVGKAVGIHNGQLHRALTQIQVRLFEEEEGGLDYVVSTSSIIEGVNTAARNVIVWSDKNGPVKLNDFTYRNIIGRGGRMFKHFVGKIFILEEPPPEQNETLQLEYPDELLGVVDRGRANIEYTPEQLAKIHSYEHEMAALIGSDELAFLQASDDLHTSDAALVLAIARDIRSNPTRWNGLRHLNSDDPNSWKRLLYRVMGFQSSAWEIDWRLYMEFLKVLASNWQKTIPEMLAELRPHNIGLEVFFKLERNTTFRLASLLGDVETIYNRIHKENPIELAPAIARFSHAFLPRVVYQLEEYGLPRMLSKKICRAGVVDLEAIQDVHEAIAVFEGMGLEALLAKVRDFGTFDIYILRYFFDGLSAPATTAESAH